MHRPASALTSRRIAQATLMLAVAALAGCPNHDDAPATTVPTPPPPPPATILTVSGVVANGAPVAGAAVSVRCAAGSASALASASGDYSVSINGGSFPCLLRATAGDGSLMHGVAASSGSSATAQLTPVTELIVARLSSSSALAYFDAFGGVTAAALTPAAVQAASSGVVEILKNGGVDLGGAGDPLTTTPSSGSAYDQGLELLQATLASSGTTLPALSQTVARTAPAAPTSTLSTLPSLPADLQLRAAAPNCGALRSGRYRLVVEEDGGGTPSTEVVTIDAPALTITNSQNQMFSLVDTGACSYSLPDSGGEAVVTKSGVIVARVDGRDNTGTLHGALLFPEQTHTLAELATGWNFIAYDRTTNNGPIHPTAGTATFDASGHLTALTFCDDVRTCTVPSTLPTLTVTADAGGGFSASNGDPNDAPDRMFVYRAGGGEAIWFILSESGHLTIATRAAAWALPPVGRTTEAWNLALSPQYTATAAMTPSKNTIASVDATSGSFVRTNTQNFSTGSTRPETILVNNLREGYTHRLAVNGVLNSDGSTSNISEFISLPLRGMDLSAYVLMSNGVLNLSATKSTTP